MNIVYIHSHDTGRYIQPYGHAISTPGLQRFAEHGVVFRNAFAAGPTCSPSRAALLTGLYPQQCGMTALAHKGGRIIDPSRHLANYLRGNGYSTALSGIQHVTESDIEEVRKLGYDRQLSRECWPSWATDAESWNQWYAKAASDYLLAVDPKKPFFLDCGFDLTHRLGKGEKWHTTRNAPAGDSRYVRPPLPLPDTPETRRDFADFIAAARQLDTCIGQVLEAVDLAGFAANTLVIITTDHGLAYPLMKCNLTAHGTGVMLMIRGPNGFSGGKVIDGLASHVDLFPTICDVAELSPPADLVGVSLQPLTCGKNQVREEIFSEVNWHAAPEPMRSVRTIRFNYIRRFLTNSGPVMSNCDDSISKTFLSQMGWDNRVQVAEELYDLMLDPNEACNCVGNPVYASILIEYRSRLRVWMEQTKDKLLSGHLAPWPGATSCQATDYTSQGEWVLAKEIRCQELRP